MYINNKSKTLLRHLRNESGIALVAAVAFSAVMLMLAVALIGQVVQYTKTVAASKQKTYSYYGAEYGIEILRDALWANGCQPPDWCGLLNNAGNDASFRKLDCTKNIVPLKCDDLLLDGAAKGAKSVALDLFARDNEDAAGSYAEDSDTIIYAFSSARDIGSDMKAETSDDSYTGVQAMIMFSGSQTYKQKGQGVAKSGASPQSGGKKEAIVRRQ
ncbi:MAG: hypothetical protein HZA20_04890 [Nitrospirae bacterium]|nr:hypothetical protein [Nitrospirota bacterium]